MDYNDISLLITHYCRSNSLKTLLENFLQQEINFGEIIVSDDASSTEHLDYLKTLQPEYDFKLITTEKNGGLGNNINKGQDAVTKPFTLYVQEDFIPLKGFAEALNEAVEILQKNPTMDIARFWSFFPYPHMKPYSENFSEMIFRKDIYHTNPYKFRVYSDNPHLRRSCFFEKFGRYMENTGSDNTELQMCLSFIRNKGRGVFLNDHLGVFDHVNSSDEPSTVTRADWRQSRFIGIRILRWFYLKYKFFKLNASVKSK